MTQVNSYIYRFLYSLYFIIMHIFYCKLFPLIHPGKILIRSAILVVYCLCRVIFYTIFQFLILLDKFYKRYVC